MSKSNICRVFKHTCTENTVKYFIYELKIWCLWDFDLNVAIQWGVRRVVSNKLGGNHSNASLEACKCEWTQPIREVHAMRRFVKILETDHVFLHFTAFSVQDRNMMFRGFWHQKCLQMQMASGENHSNTSDEVSKVSYKHSWPGRDALWGQFSWNSSKKCIFGHFTVISVHTWKMRNFRFWPQKCLQMQMASIKLCENHSNTSAEVRNLHTSTADLGGMPSEGNFLEIPWKNAFWSFYCIFRICLKMTSFRFWPQKCLQMRMATIKLGENHSNT